jgi:predicted nucleic acid-binding protein
VIVVSDTTPLNYLVLINAIDVLPRLFDEIYVPPSVVSELDQPKTPHLVRQWAKSPPAWLTIVAPRSRLASTVALGAGEADALSLAKELGINEVLIDERRGRKIAEQEGMTPLPTLAILERAAAENLLELHVAVDQLQRTNFRVPLERIHAALERDAVRKRRKSGA